MVFLLHVSVLFLPPRASEQGNVIGLVSVYISYYMSKSGICNSLSTAARKLCCKQSESEGVSLRTRIVAA